MQLANQSETMDAISTITSITECEYDIKGVTVSLSRKGLKAFPENNLFQLIGLSDEEYGHECVQDIDLSRNIIREVPRSIGEFMNLMKIDLSNNQISKFPDELLELKKLRSLNCKNNRLSCSSFPKEFEVSFPNLESLNLSGNLFINFPSQVTSLTSLKELLLGANRIRSLPREIENLQSLQYFYLGGNHLSQIPVEVGFLKNLQCLVLCDNQLTELPSELEQLKNLSSLSLHNNQLTTLPPEIIKLTNLRELSLRKNPLVVRFVRDLMWEPPSLLELAGRTIKNNKIPFSSQVLPMSLVRYLHTACHCLNPNCQGVYFDSHVETVKFVDFCGKYRLPLMQYLCSPQCYSPCPSSSSSSSDNDSDDDSYVPSNRLKKVLLG